MIFLILAIICSCIVSLGFKISARAGADQDRILPVCYLTAFVLSILTQILRDPAAALVALQQITFPIVLCAAALGFFLSWNLYLTKVNNHLNGLGVATFFTRLGFLPCLFLSMLVWGDIPSIVQSVGIVILLFAMYLMMSNQSSHSGNIPMLIILLISSAGIEFFNNLFSKDFPSELNSMFISIMYIFAFITSLVIDLMKAEQPLRFTKKDIAIGMFIGAPNFGCNISKLMSLSTISATIALPTIAASNIIIIAIISSLVYREKMTAKKVVALVLAVFSMFLIDANL